MKRILLISYYYPPLTDVGSLRALGFSKYLPQYGWEPYVLTVRNPEKGYCSIGNTQSPKGVKVFYTWSIINLWQIIGILNGLITFVYKIIGKKIHNNVFTYLFSIPDMFIGWIPLSVIKGAKIMRKHNIDMIYVSCKPLSSALIGVILKRTTKKPLIVDLRDPTIPLPFYHDQNSFSFKIHLEATRAIEKWILKRVDKLIFTTKKTEKKYLSIYPFLMGKTSHIYNGLLSEFMPKKEVEPFDIFTVIYVGNYYIEYQDSELLFQALRQVISPKRIPKNDIRFFYLGSNTSWFELMREKYGLVEIIVCHGKVSRQESIEALFKSSVIYLRIVEDMISTKLYEGLSTGNPILAAISNQEVVEIINEYSPQSIITKPHDSDMLAEAIENLYNQWKLGKQHKCVNKEYLNRFNKQYLTGEFANELNSLVPIESG